MPDGAVFWFSLRVDIRWHRKELIEGFDITVAGGLLNAGPDAHYSSNQKLVVNTPTNIEGCASQCFW